MKPVTQIHTFDEIESALSDCNMRLKLFSSDSFAKLLKHKLASLVNDPSVVLSLDVFDTLFLRDNSSELERFMGIGKAMAAIANKASKNRKVSAEDAFQARYMGTIATYRASDPVEGFREGSLIDIHRVASRLLTGSDALQDAFIDAELKYEAKTLSLNPLIATIAREHRKNGGKVLLLSDMYMHGTHIERLGEAIGWKKSDTDLVISSADEKISKASGRIFRLAEERMKAKPENFVHIGDSYKGDFQRPIQAGWRAVFLPLSEADIAERRNSHFKTAENLLVKTGMENRIAIPG